MIHKDNKATKNISAFKSVSIANNQSIANNLSFYDRYKKMAATRRFFEEYRNLARLADDLDVRFWKRFVMRGGWRQNSIDNAIAEERLRREYTACISDLAAMRADVNSALKTVSSSAADILTDYFIRDMSIEEIADKRRIRECIVRQHIQEGLFEADIPKRYRNG